MFRRSAQPHRVRRVPYLPQPDDHDADGFAALLAEVERLCAFPAQSYKPRCLRRRVAVRMRAASAHTFREYAAVLATDAAERRRLVDALTINVTACFRNWEAWAALAEHALPALASRPGELRVWSAGCSSGEEAYSLAALLHARTAAAGTAPALDVLGTDVDRESLAAAGRGTFSEAALAETPRDLREQYFPPLPLSAPAALGPYEQVAAASPTLRGVVRFARHDLLRDPTPAGPWRLVVCRNVLIYFDRRAQEAVFERLHAALEPGGVLFLGKVETLVGPSRGLFAPVDARQRLFRRL